MCAAKQENVINAAAAKFMLDLKHQEEVSNSIASILGKRNASDSTSIEKLRTETENSVDDDDLESMEGDDGHKRERR